MMKNENYNNAHISDSESRFVHSPQVPEIRTLKPDEARIERTSLVKEHLSDRSTRSDHTSGSRSSHSVANIIQPFREHDPSSSCSSNSSRVSNQPHLTIFFTENNEDMTPGFSENPSDIFRSLRSSACCYICGMGPLQDEPLMKACLCTETVHAACLLQMVRFRGSVYCDKCRIPYNLKHSGLKAIWKWRCPVHNPVWCKCYILVGTWIVLLTAICLLIAGPISRGIHLDFSVSVSLGIFLVVIICICIGFVMIIGINPLCSYCQSFCMTNQQIKVLELKESSSQSSSMDSVILKKFTNGRTQRSNTQCCLNG